MRCARRVTLHVERMAGMRVPIWGMGLVVIVGAIFMIAYGAILRDPRRHGALGVAAVALADVPDTLQAILKQIGPYRPALGREYSRLPGGLTRNPGFVDPGYMLVTAFDTRRSRYVVRMIRLADGAVMRDYAPDIAAVHRMSHVQSELIDLKRDKTNQRYMPMHPLLMADGGLLLHDTSPLTRIDACGRPLWMVDGIFHHSVEQDADGVFWAAYRMPRSKLAGVGPEFIEEGIARIDAAGQVTLRRSIVTILDQNGLGYLWRGRPYMADPFHLNDIQPAMEDGLRWKRGDLFISLRNLSTVLLYRPATGRILWYRSFPWRFQHDVNILDDHRISVFDNHWRFAFDQPEQAEVDGTNRLLVYDFATGRTSEPLAASFKRLNIRTRAQGRSTPLPNGDTMVEETEAGRVLRLAPDGQVRWRYISSDADQRRYALRWSRYLDPAADGAVIQAAVNTKCN